MRIVNDFKTDKERLGLCLTKALLNSQVAPLRLRHEVSLGDELGQVLGQHHVAVLKLVVSVLVTVVNIFLRHVQAARETLKQATAQI